MLTTQQVAERANIHVNTVRKYTDQYAELLSPEARGEAGARLFSDEDVDTLCTIAALRRTGVHPSAIIAQLLPDAATAVIDVAPTESTQTPHAAHTEPTQTALVQHEAYIALHARVEALDRRNDDQAAAQRAALHVTERTLRGEIEQLRDNQQRLLDDAWDSGWNRGVIVTLAVVGFLLLLAWLLVNGAPW